MKTLKNIALKVWTVLAVVAAVLSVASANGGFVNPKVTAVPAVLLMMFPLLVEVNILMGLLSLLIKRRIAIISLVGFLLSLYGLWNYCPINLVRPSVDGDPDRIIKVLTYNTFEYRDYEQKQYGDANRSASQVIASDADFVFIQEASSDPSDLRGRIPKSQIDSLGREYPYNITLHHLVSIHSRTPLCRVDLPQPEDIYSAWVAAETVIEQDTILLLSVHLQSIMLNGDDKSLYRKMTGANHRIDWEQGARELYRKLRTAFERRADQAEMLRNQLDSLQSKYKNVILAGDFNDISTSYAEHTICRAGMHSAFAHAGIGPMVTYHDNRFYFQIDHILYRGNLRPARIGRGSVKSSDHYPVYATFIMTNH